MDDSSAAKHQESINELREFNAKSEEKNIMTDNLQRRCKDETLQH